MSEDTLIHCSHCGDVIGVWPIHMYYFKKTNVFPMLRCPGKNHHHKVREWSRLCCFGLVECFIERYSETKTSVSGYRYCGPPNLSVLIFAMLFGVKKRRNEHYRKIRIGGRLLVWTPFHKKFWQELRQYVRPD